MRAGCRVILGGSGVLGLRPDVSEAGESARTARSPGGRAISEPEVGAACTQANSLDQIAATVKGQLPQPEPGGGQGLPGESRSMSTAPARRMECPNPTH